MIKSEDLFETEFRICIDYALEEFGRKTAQRWVDSLKYIKHHLELMPDTSKGD